MQPRSRESYSLLPIKYLRTRKFAGTPLATWALVLLLVLTIVLSVIALGAIWDSLGPPNAQTTGPLTNRLRADLVSRCLPRSRPNGSNFR